MGAFIKSKIANKLVKKKVNKSLNIGNKIGLLSVGLAVALSFTMIFFSEAISVNADTVLFEHTHSSSCTYDCGQSDSECIIGGDCDKPISEGGHMCEFHTHTIKCCRYNNLQSITITKDGIYKLEAYGSSGGNADLNCYMISDTAGGNGGYASGYISLKKGDVIYFSVPVKGESRNNGSPETYDYDSHPAGEEVWDDCNGGSGGSCTVYLNTAYSDSSVLLKAEGGGGAYVYCNRDGSDYMETGKSGSATCYTSNGITKLETITGGNTSYVHGMFRLSEYHTHEYSSVVTTQPTCTTAGVRTYTCKTCDHSYTESIAALGHDCSKVIALGTPGYEVPGQEGYFYTRDCSRCGNHPCVPQIGKFRQTVYVRYQKSDGSWGDYSAVIDEDRIYGTTVSWSRAEDDEYKAASISYTVSAKAEKRYVDVYRKQYTTSIQVRYQNENGGWGSYSTVYNQKDYYGKVVSWSRAEDKVYKAASITYTVTKDETKYVDVYRKQYRQTVNVRYQNPDGTWGEYEKVIDKDYYYGATVSWTRDADEWFQAATLSYKVTKADNKYVSIYRQIYDQKLIIHYENQDGTWWTNVEFDKKDVLSGNSIVWKWNPSDDRIYEVPRVAKDRNAAQVGSLNYLINKDVTTELWAFRKLVTLDIDSTYLTKIYEDLNIVVGTVDVYINGEKVADDVPEYYNDQLRFGSTWKVNDLKTADGYEYVGAYFSNYDEIEYAPKLLPRNTWYKGSTSRDKITAITFVDKYTLTGVETESWDASLNQTGEIMCYIVNNELIIAGNGSGRIEANEDSSYLLSDPSGKSYFSNAKTVSGLAVLDMRDVETLASAFEMVGNKVDTFVMNGMELWELDSLTDLTATFKGVGSNATNWSIGSLDNWNVQAVTSMKAMFSESGAKANSWTIGDISGWNTVSLTNVSQMFYGAGANAGAFDINLSNFKMGNVTDVSNMFGYMGLKATSWNIGDISNWNVAKVKNFSNMFNGNMGITKLNLGGWAMTAATNTSKMFDGCWKLEEITLGTKFRFVSSDGYLPSPSKDYIKDADGYWYNKNTFVEYSPAALAKRTRDQIEIYTAISPMDQPILMSGSSFVSKIPSGITSIKFTDEAVPSGVTVIDVSNKQNSSVVMWKDGTTLKISSKRAGVKVIANTDSSNMFNGSKNSVLKNVTSIDVSNLHVNNATNMNSMFANAGYSAGTFTITGLGNWTTELVEDMSSMFNNTGYSASSVSITGIENWNTSSVEQMANMFNQFAHNSSSVSLNLSKWDVSKVKSFASMFNKAGYKATNWTVGDLSNWNTSSVTTLTSMFSEAGYSAKSFSLGNLKKWDVDSVGSFYNMFNKAGYSATTWSIGELTDWNVSKATSFEGMLSYAGYKSSTFNIGNLNTWNVANSTTFKNMFSYAGYTATTWNMGDLSSWNVANATNFESMFSHAGYTTGSWNIGNLDNWKVTKATTFKSMFHNAGANSTKWNIGDLGVWDVANATNFNSMFYNAGNKLTRGSSPFGNLNSWNVTKATDLGAMFYGNPMETMDLSTWNTRKATSMKNMFTNMKYLKEITLGADFVFTSGATLPAQSSTYITGADGKWYDLDNGSGYTPAAHAALVRDHAVTYSAQGTTFVIRHYTQDLYDNTHYTLAKTENKNGAANSTINTSDYKTTLTGFTYKEAKVDGNVATKTTISKDGSRVIDLYYTRNSYKVTLVKGTGVQEVYGAGTYKYGDNVTITGEIMAGYHWSNWSGTLSSTVQDFSFTMPAKAVSETATATTNSYYIKYNGNGATSGSMTNSKHDYNVEKTLTTNSYARTGYVFSGWATSSTGSVVYTDRAKVSNLTTEHDAIVELFAVWTPSNQIKYTVKHHQQDLGKASYSLYETQDFKGTADSSITTAGLAKSYTGFTYSESQVDGAVVTSTTIKDDGTRVINLYYTRNNYYFDLNGYLDGTLTGNIAGYGLVDIYVNGTLVGNNVSDHYAEYPYGSTYTITNIVPLAGHNYDGVKSGAVEGKIAAQTNSTVLIFNRKICYIYFNANGGVNPPATQEFLFKSMPKLTTVTPTRVGYTFSHWEDADGNKFTPGQTVPAEYADFTLKAIWTVNNYSLTVNPNGGSYNGSTSNTAISGLYLTDVYVANPSRTGYTFTGWTLSGKGIHGDAQSSDSRFKSGLNSVAVYNDTGNGTTTITRVSRSSDNPTDSSYELKITTTGLGNPGYGGFHHYSIVNEAAGDTFIHSFIAKVPKGYKLNVANNSLGTGGYSQWLTSNEGTGKFEVYAVEWHVGSGVSSSALPFIYVNNDGNVTVPFTWYLAGSNVVKTNVKADGYVFKDGNGTMTANWTANTYYVRYNGNGSTAGSMSNSTHIYNTAKNLTANAFSKNGYTFKNWNLNSAGTSTSYANQASVKNLSATSGATVDLYAQWKANTITITLNKNGGTGGTTNFYYVYDTNKYYSNSSCTTAITSIALPSKSGYHFVQYNGDGTCGGTANERYVYNNGGIAGDLYYDIYKNATLTAQWEAHSYTNAITKQPTCTATGIRTYTCTVCGYQYTESVAALGHSMSGWSGWSDYSSSQHRRSRTCNRGCGYVEYGYENHNSNSYGGTSGVHTKCSTCGHTMSSSHSYTVDSGSQYSAANCTSPRYNYKRCACGYNPWSSSYIVATGNALGHSEVYHGTSSWHTYCNRCGAGLKNSGYHSYSHSYDVAPTCTSGGTNRYTCACGYSYTTAANALGHQMSGTTCTRCGYVSFTSKDFAYTGGVQSFTAPGTGYYWLEVWGAQGGNTHTTGRWEGYPRDAWAYGGYGGYAKGKVYLTQGQTIYIVVGGQASQSNINDIWGDGENITQSGGAAGYNGGGTHGNCHSGSGGGATHIATANRGVLSAYNSYRSEVLIVAGGGGGGSNILLGWSEDGRTLSASGGTGGGTSGGQGGYVSGFENYAGGRGAGGTQSSGYAFGQGGSAAYGWEGAGGGGGWYGGGYGGNYNGANTGGGGSGYIGGVSNGTMSNGIQSGNGKAKISAAN